MPTNFLSEDQRRRFGRFAEDPDEGQLAGSFLLDQTARRRAMAAKGARNRIGWAVQLGTVRYLGTFLNNPEDVPAVVVDYVAEQLGLDPAEFAGYGTKEARWDHQDQIREGYGYTKFEFDQWFALARWMYQRAWIGSERPTLLFDLATKRLVDKKGRTMPPSRSFTTRSSHSTAPLTSGDGERDAETLNSTRECPDKNLHGRYSFALPAEVQGGQLRSTRKPEGASTTI